VYLVRGAGEVGPASFGLPGPPTWCGDPLGLLTLRNRFGAATVRARLSILTRDTRDGGRERTRRPDEYTISFDNMPVPFRARFLFSFLNSRRTSQEQRTGMAAPENSCAQLLLCPFVMSPIRAMRALHA
jgi:hypothetical protein